MATSDVVVALCSPRYLLSEACGRQWWVFESRLRRVDRDQTDARPSPLIALAWTSDAAMPPGVAPAWRSESGRGLRQLVRLHRLRGAYEDALTVIAKRVIAASQAPLPPLAEPLPSYEATPNAFASHAADALPADGAPRIRFVIAAGTRQEMRAIRENLIFYGATREQWAPYVPMVNTPIAQRAGAVAAAHLYQPEFGSVDDLIHRIEGAGRDDQPVIVLVDAWAVQVDTIHHVLAELDRRGLAGAAVLVPMNFADAETVQHRRDLRFGLKRLFRTSTDNRDARLRGEIGTPDQFDADLAAVIEEARNKTFRGARVHRLLPGDPPGERPILRGP